MMISRFQKFSKSFHSKSIFRPKFSTYNNPDPINEIILKHKKNINPQTFKEILDACKDQQKIHIFKITWFTKLFFLVSRYQVLAYCIGGGLYSFYIMQEKWEKIKAIESKEKVTKREQKEVEKNKQKIVFGGIALILCGIFGSKITLEMGKRLVKNIYWLPKENKFELNYFSFLGFSKPVVVSPEQITKLDKSRRFDSTIVWEMKGKPKGYQLISTKGTGKWIDKDIFEYIINNSQNLSSQNMSNQNQKS